MVLKDKVISLSEFEEIPTAALEAKIGKRGIRLLKRINSRSGCEIFCLMHDKVKASQYVGFVRVLGYTIQVVPKVFRDDKPKSLQFLLCLLRYTKKIQVKEHEIGNLGKVKDDFFEILIFLFAKSLRELLRRDFKKMYVVHEENSSFLKGKFLISENVRRNIFDDSRYCCRFDEFTENNLMNQIFKYVVLMLIRISGSVSNKKLLEDILIYLCDVQLLNITCADIDRIHFTHLNRAYEPLVNLCRLFLENMSIRFSASKLETFVFMFDMNRLFEEFVFEFIKSNRSKIFVSGDDPIIFVKDQMPLGKLFGEFKMRGDVLIQCGSGEKLLLDTKYKVLDDDFIHGGLSQSDFYQMFAYSTSQEQRYRDIILLYPCRETVEDSSVSKVLRHILENKEISRVHVKTVSLPKIFDAQKNRIDENAMVSELNKALMIEWKMVQVS